MIKIVTRKNDSTTRTVHGSTLESLRDGISDLRHNDFKLYDGKGILIG